MRLSRLIFSTQTRHQLQLTLKRFGTTQSVPLTSERKPYLKRHDFARLTDTDLKTFESILGGNRILTEPDDLEGYNTDWMRIYRGNSAVVLRPKTVEEVSALLRYCNERKLAVVPQGGNTGLVGGGVPVFDEVIISLGLMNQILDVNPITGLALCESGVILEQLDLKLKDNGLCAPLDLGAKGSCQIGGNISTNAGGLRLLRYGPLRSTVLGLEAVLPNGEVMDCLNSLRKDNTGYDLKQLFIGAEGTLGVVTKVAIQCPPAPKSVNVAFLGVESYEKVLNTFKQTKSYLSEILSACELIDSHSLECVERKLGYKNPLSTSYPFYLLLETSGSSETHDMEKLNVFLEMAMNESLIQDGIIAQDSQQVQRIWTVRESIAPALNQYETFLCFDVSLKLNNYYEIVEEMHKYCQADNRLNHLLVTGFGHLGDGNIHLNFVTDTYSPEVADLLEPFIFDWVSQHRGSISAEHGLGLSKNSYLHLNKPSIAIELMKALKATVDPNGIMNPYKYLPPKNLSTIC